jgi:hypothetical protein
MAALRAKMRSYEICISDLTEAFSSMTLAARNQSTRWVVALGRSGRSRIGEV